MERFLFRVRYEFADGTVTYEPVCVRAADDDESAARTEVLNATQRYAIAVGASRTLTLVTVTPDV